MADEECWRIGESPEGEKYFGNEIKDVRGVSFTRKEMSEETTSSNIDNANDRSFKHVMKCFFSNSSPLTC